MFRRILVAIGVFVFSLSVFAQADNYPDRKAIILNTFPSIELSGFAFANVYKDGRTRFHQDMRWKNVGDKPLAAFEIVILKYDAFDQRLIGSRWAVTGRDSANWTYLNPGDSAGDGLRGFGSEEIMTAIAYVRTARYADGTVWRVNDNELVQKLKGVASGIKDFGSVKPDTKPSADQK
jgi:hypothetical protein